MKIAFVSLNREQMPDAAIPLGLLYVMAAGSDRHRSILLDVCFEPDPETYLRERVETFAPDVVAIGIRNIQNNDYSGTRDNLEYYRRMIAAIRSVSRAVVVVGGSGFSVMPEALMDALSPDYGIAGEGERTFWTLVEGLESGARGSFAIEGLYAPTTPAVPFVKIGARSAFLSLDDLRPPDRTRVDPRYRKFFAIDSIQTKRGCPLRCTYCTYPTIEGRASRQRSPSRVVDELEAICAEPDPPRHVFVVDSTFNLPMHHAKAICREMIARSVSIPWTCYANPLGLDDELAELMARAHCAGMEIGSDSGCDEILTALEKGFDTALIRRTHELSVRHGLRDCHTFVLGTRGESMEHVMKTIEFAIELDPFAVIFMIYRDDADAFDGGGSPQRRAFEAAIERLLGDLAPAHLRWIVPSLGINFDERKFAALRRHGFSGPLWQYIDRRRS